MYYLIWTNEDDTVSFTSGTFEAMRLLVDNIPNTWDLLTSIEELKFEMVRRSNTIYNQYVAPNNAIHTLEDDGEKYYLTSDKILSDCHTVICDYYILFADGSYWVMDEFDNYFHQIT